MTVVKKGFTLLELVVVGGIFIIAICAILLLFIAGAALDNANRNKTIASTHAESVLEYANSLGFAAVRQNLCNGSGTWILPLSTLSLSGLDGEQPVNVTTTTADYCTADILDVTATITWFDKNARQRTLSEGTLISR